MSMTYLILDLMCKDIYTVCLIVPKDTEIHKPLCCKSLRDHEIESQKDRERITTRWTTKTRTWRMKLSTRNMKIVRFIARPFMYSSESKELPKRHVEPCYALEGNPVAGSRDFHYLKAQENHESVGLNRSLQTLALPQSSTAVRLFSVVLAFLAFSVTSRGGGRVRQILSLSAQSLPNSLELGLVIRDDLTILITGFDGFDCIPKEELIRRESKWLRTIDSSGRR